jgi:GNAT superfamily N-acetyltransferase
MAVPILFALPLADLPPPTGLAAAAMPAVHATIAPVDPAADAAAVVTLADACRRDEGPQAGHVAPAGLLGELASRPGRHVRAWLAWPGDDAWEAAPPVADPVRPPLGLVTLVVATSAAGPRYSIGWLLVHPAARRRGVARRLVGAAVAAAAAAGAREVSAETLAAWPAAVAFWRAAGFRERGR